MKTIALFALLLGLPVANAVVRKNCPDSIKVSLNQFEVDNVSNDDFISPDNRNFPYNGNNRAGMIELRKSLKERKIVTSTLTKQDWSTPAKCYYHGETTDGQKASAYLKGSLRAGAKEPATMVFYNGDLVVYISLVDIQTSGLVAEFQDVPLYYAGEQCSWGECIPDHIKIGEGHLDYLE